MLLSQRIAKDIGFLKPIAKHVGVSAFDLRLKVMKAIKILVGTDMLDASKSIAYRHVAFSESMGNDKKKIDERVELYGQYSHLPYNSIFIENETGGLYVEKGVFRQTPGSKEVYDTMVIPIDENGLMLPTRALVNLGSGTTCTEMGFYCTTSEGQAMQRILINCLGGDSDKAMEAFKDILSTSVYEVLEVLLFMNLANVTLTSVKPAKKEISMVPKNMLPFYEYKILDVYRTKTVYPDLESAARSLGKGGKDAVQRRAHLVRGHFKHKNGKLFWWNSFMRNRRNITTHGIVDKDYQLKDE